MSRNIARLAASVLFGLAIGVTALKVAVWALIATMPAVPEKAYLQNPLGRVVEPAWPLATCLVGLLIVWHRPRNAIGWPMLAFGLNVAALTMLQVSNDYTVVAGEPLPSGHLILRLGVVGITTALALLSLLLQLYPTGRPLSRRWTVIAWATAALPVLFLALSALEPAFLPASPAPPPMPAQLLELTQGVALAASTLSVVVRMRRARGDERQQIKWLAYGALPIGAIFVLYPLIQGVVVSIFGSEAVGWLFVLQHVAFLSVPIAIGIAIRRYRLYDIDHLINRTLVYGATTIGLGAAFFGGIVALQAALSPFTSGSDLAIAASTLVAFALFQPIRRRIQDGVDRRFDRSRYDAARTLDLFADRLRDEVDLDALRTDLLGAVRQTMAPAHASLWLRERA
jgi:hypothetical protein